MTWKRLVMPGWKLVSLSLPWFLVVSDRAVDTMGSAKHVLNH